MLTRRFDGPDSGPWCLYLIRVLALIACAMAGPVSAGDAKCKLGEIVKFPITMVGLRPMVDAKLNGTDVRFTLDSGAFYSVISPASAAALKLKLRPAPPGFYVEGIGGRISVQLTTTDSFYLNGTSLHGVEFIVGGNDEFSESIGFLGRNFLQLADVEFDLAQGMVRLMSAQDCDAAVLAYWAHRGDSYSVMTIDAPQNLLFASNKSKAVERFLEPITGTAMVNGHKIRVIFDTGAPDSYLTVKAAERAGIKVGSPGVVAAGYGGGFGRGWVANYIAQVASFKIGDEEIRNTRLRLGDTTLGNDADMLIGADFFLSHHIYVANSQHKLYFTYNGGSVFNLKTISASSSPTPAGSPAGSPGVDSAIANTAAHDASVPVPQAAAGSAQPAATQGADQTAEAGDYARRGNALAARRDFDQALVALTRACELAPKNPDYAYQRGYIYWQASRADDALADFDRTLSLKRDHLPALMARGELRIQRGDEADAVLDFAAANALMPKEDVEHLVLATDFVRLGHFEQSVWQYDLWIDSHPVDAKLYGALDGRCRARALGDIDLPRALEDCNQALKHAQRSSQFYADVMLSRGLVWWRMGHYDRSIADFGESLKIRSRDAWSLYGRGLAEIRIKNVAKGEADIAQAKAISADIGEQLGKFGIAR